MCSKRPEYRAETFKMVLLIGGFFAVGFYLRNGGFTKTEGIALAVICSVVWFFLGRIAVPPGPPD
jgi:hypothetical protein